MRVFTVPKKSETLHKNRACHDGRSGCNGIGLAFVLHITGSKPDIYHWICSTRDRLCFYAEIQIILGQCSSCRLLQGPPQQQQQQQHQLQQQQQQLQQQQQGGGVGSSNSEGESPVSLLDDVKPPADFFSHFYQSEDVQASRLHIWTLCTLYIVQYCTVHSSSLTIFQQMGITKVPICTVYLL